MPFTGKATYDAGADLPELAEDVSDLIGIVSPHETPLLDLLGDPRRPATSTVHEWIEDELLPNTDTIPDQAFSPSGTTAETFFVSNGARFRPGDLVRPADGPEVMRIDSVDGDSLDVTRGYGGTDAVELEVGMTLHILGNAALEGGAADEARFTTRVRRRNFTQIFAATVNVSGTMRAVRTHAVEDELDYQKQERLRELLRDLENTVINGVAPEENAQGGQGVRRTMNGIIPSIATNRFVPGEDGFPSGEQGALDEPMLNAALRTVWERSAGGIDTIVVNGAQKRRINGFMTASRSFMPQDTRFRDMVSTYESDFGLCRVVLSRWVPRDAALLLDASRLEVMPLQGRSFHFRPLSAAGDNHIGQVLGEYTLEMRNENAHALITGLSL